MTQPAATAPIAPPAPVADLLRSWLSTQALLLDDPRAAAIESGRLVGDAMRLAMETFDQQRRRIEQAWPNDSAPDTDELRSILQRHKSLFEYVLAADELLDQVEALGGKPREVAPRHGAAAVQSQPDPNDALASVVHAGRPAGRCAVIPDRHRWWRQSRVAQWITGSTARTG